MALADLVWMQPLNGYDELKPDWLVDVEDKRASILKKDKLKVNTRGVVKLFFQSEGYLCVHILFHGYFLEYLIGFGQNVQMSVMCGCFCR